MIRRASIDDRPADRPPSRAVAGVRSLRWSRAGAGGLVVLGTALLIDHTVRDRVPWLAPVFYMMPFSVVAVGAGTLALLFLRLRRRRRALASLGLALVALFGAPRHWYVGRPPAGPPGGLSLRVMTWNLFHLNLGTEGVMAVIREHSPDLVALLECGEELGHDAWTRGFPEYHIRSFGGQIRVLSRFPFAHANTIFLGPRSRLVSFSIRPDERVIHAGIVDLVSNPLADRRPSFARLRDAWQTARPPHIVLGDFNTPRRSVHFDALRGIFHNTFEAAGRGFGYTWPSIIPLWDLDQIWVDDSWHVESCRVEWTWHSDHCPVIAELDWK